MDVTQPSPGASVHPNAALIERLYDALTRHDGQAMAACYAPGATFSDPVFTHLQGPRIGAMWRMLCAQGKDLQVRASDIHADEQGGRAHWDADYTFSGRPVHNHVDAHFTFRDGLIVSHTDTFDLWAWSRMALGPAGLLLGWSSLLQGKLRTKAMQGLDRWEREEAEGW